MYVHETMVRGGGSIPKNPAVFLTLFWTAKLLKKNMESCIIPKVFFFYQALFLTKEPVSVNIPKPPKNIFPKSFTCVPVILETKK